MEESYENILNKRNPYKGEYNTWKSVLKMMKKLGLVIVSTEEQYNEQKTYPSHKKISFYRKDDIEKKIFQDISLSCIKSGNSRGLTINDKKIIYKIESINKRLLIDKGDCHNNKKELNRTNLLFNMFYSIEYEDLMEFRLNDIAIRYNKNLYSGCQIKTGMIGDNNQVNFETKFTKMLEYIKHGESIIFISVDRDQTINTVWFLYNAIDLQKLIETYGDKSFAPRPNPTKKTSLNKHHILFMNNFKYTIPEDILKLENEIKSWLTISRKMPIEYWNFDNEQIPCFEHKQENSANLFLKERLLENDIKIEFKNYDQIDIIINGCSIQSKIISPCNRFNMLIDYKKNRNGDYKRKSIPYDINVIDAFLCFESNSHSKEDLIKKENYTKCRIIPTRKDGKSNINVDKHQFSFYQHNKLNREIEYFDLTCNFDIQKLINYLDEIKNRKKVI